MHALVIGSSVIDLFLQSDPDHVKEADGKVTLNLGDKIPSEIKKITLGGNGSNVSVGLTRLEIPSTFYTYLGNDILAREIEEGLTSEGVELIGDKDRDSFTSLSVILDFNSDRIIFSNHKKKDHVFNDPKGNYDFIYLTSIGNVWENAYNQIVTYAKTYNTPIAFSPGSHQIEDINETVINTLKASKIVFVNREEAIKLLKINSQNSFEDIKQILTEIKNMGPEIVSVTDGVKGAYAIDKDGKMYHMETIPSEVTERTGAGDAYASGFFASFLKKNDVPTSMRWGTINANAVTKLVGAQAGLLKQKDLDNELLEHNNLVAQSI